MALEQDRQVFALSLKGKGRGSNCLLKEGAKLVMCDEDVIEKLVPQLATKQLDEARRQPTVSETGKPEEVASTPESLEVNESKIILHLLKHDKSLHVDSLIKGSGLKPQNVLRLLLEL